MTLLPILSLSGCFIIDELLPEESEQSDYYPIAESSISGDPSEEEEPFEPPLFEPEPAPEPAPEPTVEPEDTGEESLCDENDLCTLTVTNAETFGCDSSVPQEIVFSNSGTGSLFVYHKSIYDGCCPEFTASATADLTTSTIEVEYTLDNDFCDCVCEGISVRYTLSDIPPGTYQLNALTDSVTVVLE
jgi:hypothetical protein